MPLVKCSRMTGEVAFLKAQARREQIQSVGNVIRKLDVRRRA
jgi:hypothetical protein